MLTPEEANRRSKETRSFVVASEWAEIEQMIDATSDRGEFFISLRKIYEENKQRLIDMKYQVGGDFLYTVVRWG